MAGLEVVHPGRASSGPATLGTRVSGRHDQRMTWEIGAAWAGVLVAVVFGIANLYRSKATRQAAATAIERSEEALAAYSSMARSLDAIAENTQSHPRPGPRGVRSDQGSPSDPPTQGDEGTQTTKPAWNIEYRTGQAYALRNLRAEPSTHVMIDAGTSIARNLPQPPGVRLEPNQAHTFMLIGAMGAPLPTDVVITCAELGAQRVAIPGRFA